LISCPNRAVSRGLLAAIAAVVAWGCGPIYLNSLFGRGAQPAPAAPPPAPTAARVAPQSTVVVAKPKPSPSPQSVKHPVEPVPILSLAPASDTTPDASSSERAHQEVEAAARQLAAVDPSKLSGRNAADYRLVDGFIADAQRALRDQDFVKAESLAEKASALASQLASRTAAAGSAKGE
jgi:hypothetical protein